MRIMLKEGDKIVKIYKMCVGKRICNKFTFYSVGNKCIKTKIFLVSNKINLCAKRHLLLRTSQNKWTTCLEEIHTINAQHIN